MLHTGVVRKVLFRGERWCVFSLQGDSRTREKLWCVCPLGTLLLGLQEALLHLSVCVCVLCVCVLCVYVCVYVCPVCVCVCPVSVCVCDL